MRVKLRGISSRSALIALALLTEFHPAYSHGIAGNRYFDGTLTFDDPAVADEAILPYYTYLEQPTQGSNAIENRINFDFRAQERMWLEKRGVPVVAASMPGDRAIRRATPTPAVLSPWPPPSTRWKP